MMLHVSAPHLLSAELPRAQGVLGSADGLATEADRLGGVERDR